MYPKSPAPQPLSGSPGSWPPPYPPPPSYYEGMLSSPEVGTQPAPTPAQTWPGAGEPALPQPRARRGGGAFISVLSAVVSFAVYYYLFGQNLVLASGIMALLFVHEMGHYIVIRAKGEPAGLPVFIPLAGAYVTLKRMPPTVRDEAEIALAGPLAGGLGGIVCLGLAYVLHQETYTFLAYLTFALNLLNMAPIAPLDGSRISGAISRWMWLLGIVLVLGVIVGAQGSFRIYAVLLAILGIPEAINRFRLARLLPSYFRIGVASRIYIAVLYALLTLGLTGGLVISQLIMNGVIHL